MNSFDVVAVFGNKIECCFDIVVACVRSFRMKYPYSLARIGYFSSHL